MHWTKHHRCGETSQLGRPLAALTPGPLLHVAELYRSSNFVVDEISFQQTSSLRNSFPFRLKFPALPSYCPVPLPDRLFGLCFFLAAFLGFAAFLLRLARAGVFVEEPDRFADCEDPDFPADFFEDCPDFELA